MNERRKNVAQNQFQFLLMDINITFISLHIYKR